MNNFKKLIKEALTPHYLRESVNEDFTHSSLAITDQSQISGLDDSELLDLLNKVSYEYTPELKDSARIISQEIEDRDLTNKIHYVDNERYEFRESINEADKYVDARGNFKLRNGLEVKIKPASEIKKFNIGKDYMKYNLQIAGKTVKIEKAFRGEFGGAPSQFKVKGYDYFKTWSSGKPRDGFDQIIIDDVVRESINENVDEGQYRIYMNSDADDPKRVNYEEYFESGTKDEMVRMAKKWIAEPDAKNMYGDPLLVSVTHEDYIDIVDWANEPVNEDIQPLAVEELTDEALLDMLNNIDDMSRDKKGGTYDMSGRKMTRAQYDLAKSVEAEVRRRNLDLSLDIDDSYEIGESVNEGFEWY